MANCYHFNVENPISYLTFQVAYCSAQWKKTLVSLKDV